MFRGSVILGRGVGSKGVKGKRSGPLVAPWWPLGSSLEGLTNRQRGDRVDGRR